MTAEETTGTLRRIISAYERSDTAVDSMIEFGLCVESKPIQGIHWLQSDLIQICAGLLGDDCEWIEWFIFENDCGRKGLLATNGEDIMKPIRTVEDLAELIARPA